MQTERPLEERLPSQETEPAVYDRADAGRVKMALMIRDQHGAAGRWNVSRVEYAHAVKQQQNKSHHTPPETVVDSLPR